MPVLLRSMNAKALILADKSFSMSENMSIVNLCLDFNIKVFTLPAIADWENQNEISKKVKNIQIEDLLERSPIVLDK